MSDESELKKKKSALSKNITLLDSKIKKLENDIKILKEEISNLELLVDSIQKTIAELKLASGELNGAGLNFFNVYKSDLAITKHSELGQYKTDVDNDISSLEKARDDALKRIEKNKKLLAEKEQELKKLKGELVNMNSELHGVMNKLGH